jgi:hypothetical protein
MAEQNDQRVSIVYLNGTTVEANNLHEALIHVAQQGTDYVEGIIEDVPSHSPCSKCGGDGVVENGPGKTVLSKSKVADAVKEINEIAPIAEASFDDRVQAAAQVAKA